MHDPALTFWVLGEPVIQELWRLLEKESDTLELRCSITTAPYKDLAGMSGLLFILNLEFIDTAPLPQLLTLFLSHSISQLQRMDFCVR